MVQFRTILQKKYSHIFFDLDRTLWDFDQNSQETLTELYYRYNLDKFIESPDVFVDIYHNVNLELWDLYRKGEMTKEVLRIRRFQISFDHFRIRDDELASNFGDDYLAISPTKTILVPHTIETLDYLSLRYKLHIITNGFLKTQEIKMENCGLDKYFESLTTSETVGHNKPRPEIFHHALSSVNARKKESIMIGDDLSVDILGAKKFGIDQVFLNRDKIIHKDKITHEIKVLTELLEIL